MKLEEIRKMPFEEFRAMHSIKAAPIEKVARGYNFAGQFDLLTSNEEIPIETCRKIEAAGGIYLGIIGGIDQVFTHLSFQKPELAILFDLNEATIDYLQIRLEMLKDSPDLKTYLQKLFKTKKPIENLLEADIWKLYDESGTNPNALAKYLVHYNHPEFDPKKYLRNYIGNKKDGMLKLYSAFDFLMLHNPEKLIYFFSEERFKIVKKLAEGDAIKAFAGEAFGYAFGKCLDILGEERRKVKTIYESNALSLESEDPKYSNELLLRLFSQLPDDINIISGMWETAVTKQQMICEPSELEPKMHPRPLDLRFI